MKLNEVLFKLQRKIRRFPLRPLYMPTVVQIDITTGCNLNCAHCPSTVLEASDRDKSMSWETFKKISPYLSYAKDVCLFGVGEPLLSSIFWDVLTEICSKNIPVHFQTNGMLWTEKDIIRIVDLGVAGMYFSIDATEPALFEKIRYGVKFNKVVDNIKSVNIIKKDRNSILPQVEIFFTCQRDNIDEIPKIIKFAKEVGVTSVAFQNIMAYNRNSIDKAIYNLDQRLIQERFISAKKESEKLQVKISRIPKFLPQNKICELPWYFMYFRWDGKASPCSYFQYKFWYQYIILENKITKSEMQIEPFLLGDINKQSIREIWNSEIMYRIRKSFISGEQLIFPCNICLVRCGLH